MRSIDFTTVYKALSAMESKVTVILQERSKENIHMSEWVSFMVAHGDIKTVEIAMLCVFPTSTKRPTTSQVVAELKDCLTTEIAQKEGYEGESNYTIEMYNINLATELNPLAQ
ncbi:lrr receptor-like serine/threonine-protein kinase ios1 [Quercus suber]|uniref:Lrr receptor-like serine/threonine-protein kinase ios1 n=1 Tax=Quercus suber TaxID=58331 RepID=A0AAW0KX14_QUESU